MDLDGGSRWYRIDEHKISHVTSVFPIKLTKNDITYYAIGLSPNGSRVVPYYWNAIQKYYDVNPDEIEETQISDLIAMEGGDLQDWECFAFNVMNNHCIHPYKVKRTQGKMVVVELIEVNFRLTVNGRIDDRYEQLHDRTWALQVMTIINLSMHLINTT